MRKLLWLPADEIIKTNEKYIYYISKSTMAKDRKNVAITALHIFLLEIANFLQRIIKIFQI